MDEHKIIIQMMYIEFLNKTLVITCVCMLTMKKYIVDIYQPPCICSMLYRVVGYC